MLNCIVLCDKTSSTLIKDFASRNVSLNLTGVFNDSAAALNHLSERNNIDVAIIDVKIAGSETINRIRSLNNPPNIIGLLSDRQNAKEPFIREFIDHLVKPFSYSDFCRAVDKASRYYSSKDQGNSDDREIFVRKDSALVRVSMKDITYIEALENYVILNTPDKKYTIHFTMKGIESQLPHGNFLRVHRSYIVNKSLIKTMNENNLQLMQRDNLISLPVGKSFRNEVMNDIRVMNK